jgi:hypothetical protein
MKFWTRCILDHDRYIGILHGGRYIGMLHDGALTEKMTRCMSLRNVNFENCNFQGASFLENNVVALACGLANVPHLVKVKLAKCGIGDDAMCQVVESFRTHYKLQCLYLNDNSCSLNKSIQAVARLLSPRRGSRLVDLNLSRVWGSDLPDDIRFGPLFAALSKNKRLKRLNMRFLGKVYLPQEDLVLLTDAIRANTTLETLDIAKVGIESTGFELLQEALSANHSLYRFWGGRTMWPQSNFYPHFNRAGRGLLSNTTTPTTTASAKSQQSVVPFGLWALLLARVTAKTKETNGSYGSNYSGTGDAIPKVLYQMLRCPNGERTSGLLAVELAMRYLRFSGNHPRSSWQTVL